MIQVERNNREFENTSYQVEVVVDSIVWVVSGWASRRELEDVPLQGKLILDSNFSRGQTTETSGFNKLDASSKWNFESQF